MSEGYIVQVLPKTYFAGFVTRRRRPTPIGVRAMSLGRRFNYRDADRLCVFLHEEGYPCASVCDIFGDLVTRDSVNRSSEKDTKYLHYPRTRSEYRGLVRLVAHDLIHLWKSQDIVFAAAVNKFEKRPTRRKRNVRNVTRKSIRAEK